MTAPYGCGRCENRWGGERTCHCARCHHTFSSLSGFDAHRRGDVEDRYCEEPDLIGMVKNNYGYWTDAETLERVRSVRRP